MKICYNCFNGIPAGERNCPRCGCGADLRNENNYPQALPCGTILNGKYVVGRVLGQGGFGITYIGQRADTKKIVAIKEYFPNAMASRDVSHTIVPLNTNCIEDFQYGKKQFLEEAKTLATFIGSPNIVRVHSYFEENGTAYFVMEYVRGQSLGQYIQRRGGRISWEEAWDLLMPILEALSEVHYRNIVHRDIKPDNILVTKEGRAKLIDFGAARYSQGEMSKDLTAVLTPGYAPLEQYYTRSRQGAWTDVYALAATIYFCITGEKPISSVERSDEDTLKKPSELGGSIPEYAEAALMKALAVKVNDRFESTYDFRNAVLEGKSLEEEEKTVAYTRTYRTDKPVKGGNAVREKEPQGVKKKQRSLDSGIQRKEETEEDTGQLKKIFLALAIVVFIAAVVFAISTGNRSSNSKTGTGESNQIAAKTEETDGQNSSSPPSDKVEEEEPKETGGQNEASSSAEKVEEEKPEGTDGQNEASSSAEKVEEEKPEETDGQNEASSSAEKVEEEKPEETDGQNEASSSAEKVEEEKPEETDGQNEASSPAENVEEEPVRENPSESADSEQDQDDTTITGEESGEDILREEITSTTVLEKGTVYSIKTAMYMYEEPSVDSPVLEVIKDGWSVYIEEPSEQGNGWHRVALWLSGAPIYGYIQIP